MARSSNSDVFDKFRFKVIFFDLEPNKTPNKTSFASLSPEDIESINILTGASASALYGSEAANGVMLWPTDRDQS